MASIGVSAATASGVEDSFVSGWASIGNLTMGLMSAAASFVIGLGLYALGVSQTIHVTDTTARF